jgi:hypothetical protein
LRIYKNLPNIFKEKALNINMKKKVKDQRKKLNGTWNIFAILGFIFSFISWFSILGIALSIVGIIETKKNKQKGRTLAIAGLIIGIIVLIAKADHRFPF